MTIKPFWTTRNERFDLNRYVTQMLEERLDPDFVDRAQELARTDQGTFNLIKSWWESGENSEVRREIENDLKLSLRDNQILLVDADNVLVDFTKACLDLAARQLNVFATPEDVTGDEIGPSIGCPALEYLIDDEVLHKEFCYQMQPIRQGVLFFKALEEIYGKDRVFVCTKPWRGDNRERATGEWASQRYAWLRDHLGVNKGRVFMCDHKHMVDGILVDDSVKNLEKRKSGTGFCIAHPYNTRWKGPRGNYQDCLNWLKG